jgi:hypothetical protein
MRSTWSPPAIFLVLLMGVGSIVMWLGVPLGLVYAASNLADTSAPPLGPYLLVFIGLPIGMAVMAKLLGYLDRLHQSYTRTGDDRPQQAPWMRSMRGERGSTRKRGVLDTVMIVSVGLALVRSLVWVGTRTTEFAATSGFFRDVLGLGVHSSEPDFTVLELPDGATVEVFGPSSPYNEHLTHPVGRDDASRGQLVTHRRTNCNLACGASAAGGSLATPTQRR